MIPKFKEKAMVSEPTFIVITNKLKTQPYLNYKSFFYNYFYKSVFK